MFVGQTVDCSALKGVTQVTYDCTYKTEFHTYGTGLANVSPRSVRRQQNVKGFPICDTKTFKLKQFQQNNTILSGRRKRKKKGMQVYKVFDTHLGKKSRGQMSIKNTSGGRVSPGKLQLTSHYIFLKTTLKSIFPSLVF